MTPGKHNRRSRLLFSALAVAAAGGVIGLSWADAATGSEQTATSAAQADSSQLTEVKADFTSAITADRSVQAPPNSAVSSSALAATTGNTPSSKVPPQPSSAVRQKQLSDGLAELSKYFTPAQAQHEAIGLRNVVSKEADATWRSIGSGVSKVTFTQVAVSGSTATVQAQVAEWTKSQIQQPNGAWVTINPVGTMAYTATLVQNSTGQWVISSLQGDFVPGEGP